MLLVMKTHNDIGVFQSVNTKVHKGSWCDGAFLLPLKGKKGKKPFNIQHLYM